MRTYYSDPGGSSYVLFLYLLIKSVFTKTKSKKVWGWVYQQKGTKFARCSLQLLDLELHYPVHFAVASLLFAVSSHALGERIASHQPLAVGALRKSRICAMSALGSCIAKKNRKRI